MPIRASEKARYPKDWKSISLRIRRDRAEWRCECTGQCGLDHGGRCMRVQGEQIRPNVPTARVVLTVMHLDHTPESCADDNLLAACQACHLRYDSKHHQRNAHATRRARKARGDLFDD